MSKTTSDLLTHGSSAPNTVSACSRRPLSIDQGDGWLQEGAEIPKQPTLFPQPHSETGSLVGNADQGRLEMLLIKVKAKIGGKG